MSVDLGMPATPPAPLAPRRHSRQLMVGNVPVGGGAPVSVQSMCTTLTADVNATLQVAIGNINSLAKTPEFLIHTGDLTHSAKPSEFDTLAHGSARTRLRHELDGAGHGIDFREAEGLGGSRNVMCHTFELRDRSIHGVHNVFIAICGG